jgi:CubicO group peptidase (beta-lactamase class C family)
MSDIKSAKPFWMLIAVLLAAPSAAPAQQTAVAPVNPAQLATEIDAILDAEFLKDQPGAAVIVLHNGEPLYTSARGLANLELDVPMTRDMLFRIGSMTKQFTAAAIMLLVEEGRISLDDDITRFLPDYPTQGTTITVEHLLTHTSGIRSYTDMPGWMETEIIRPMTVDELIDGFKNEPMDFRPGEEFRYNNSGYILLGAIIEKVSGQSYADFLQKRIFDPLHMVHSRYGDHSAVVKNRAAGYDGSPGNWQNARYLDMSQPYAAGALLSTVEDLGKWNTALFAGKVVGHESLQRMTTDYRLNNGSLAGYGCGLVPGDVRGHKSVSHGGGIFGFVTHGICLPDDDLYVAVLCNCTARDPAAIANRIAAAAAGDPFPVFKAVEVSPEVLERYVGVYKIDETLRRYVTVENGRLYTQRTGSSRLAALPSSETGFFYEATPSHFEFVLDDQGAVTGMRMYQGGSKEAQLAERVDEAMPAARTVAEIDFAVYDEYVGEYQLVPGFSISVTRDGDHLFAQGTGQPSLEIFPASATEFFLQEVDAEIDFLRDENGAVNQIELKQAGQKMIGKRK